jgi:hypothetical protein
LQWENKEMWWYVFSKHSHHQEDSCSSEPLVK